MTEATLTGAQRFELIRASVFHYDDLQCDRRTSEALSALGLARPVGGSGLRWHVTPQGHDLAWSLARADVEAAEERNKAEGRAYERPSTGRLF